MLRHSSPSFTWRPRPNCRIGTRYLCLGQRQRFRYILWRQRAWFAATASRWRRVYCRCTKARPSPGIDWFRLYLRKLRPAPLRVLRRQARREEGAIAQGLHQSRRRAARRWGPLFNGVNRSSCIPASIAKPASTANRSLFIVSGFNIAFPMSRPPRTGLHYIRAPAVNKVLFFCSSKVLFFPYRRHPDLILNRRRADGFGLDTFDVTG